MLLGIPEFYLHRVNGWVAETITFQRWSLPLPVRMMVPTCSVLSVFQGWKTVYQAVKSLWKLKSSNSKGFKNMFVHQNSDRTQSEANHFGWNTSTCTTSLDARGFFSPLRLREAIIRKNNLLWHCLEQWPTNFDRTKNAWYKVAWVLQANSDQQWWRKHWRLPSRFSSQKKNKHTCALIMSSLTLQLS